MNPYSIPPLLSALAFFSVGAAVLIKSKESLPSRFAFILHCIATFWWQFSWFVLFNLKNEASASLLVKIGYSGIIFIPVTFFHFYIAYLEKDKKWVRIYYSVGFLFLISVWLSNLFINGYYSYFWGYYPKAGYLHPAYLLYLTIIALHCFYVLLLTGKQIKWAGIKGNQIKYLAIALFLYCFAISDFAVNYGIGFYPLGVIFILASVGIVSYAIVKHHLMDIRVALTRAGIFTVVYGVIFLIPLFTVFASRPILERIKTALYALLASAAPFIYIFLQRRAENLLLKEQRRYQNALIQLSTTLTLTKDQDRLLKLIVLKVAKQVKVNFACIYLDTQNQDKLVQKFPYTTEGFFPNFLPTVVPHSSYFVSYLKKHKRPILAEELPREIKADFNLKSGLIVPSFIKQKLLGFLMLGPKSSGGMYGEEDVMVFKILSSQIGLAIENTQFIKALDEMHVKVVEAEKLKGIAQLLYSLNHEFRNLFNNMTMPMQMIVMGVYKDKPQELDDILKRIDKFLNQAVEILGFLSSFINKSDSKEVKPMKTETIVAIGVNYFQDRLKEANIKVITQIAPDLPPIPAMPTLGDLALNIIANSYFNLMDKTQEDKHIHMQATLSEDKTAIQLKISDTGSDMTKDADRHDTGSPFKERGKLGGVNLGIAYLIANQHEATIKIASYEKGGTTFIVNIPITQKGPTP